jgi:hypothetical protein
MDIERIKNSLNEFALSLADKPKWVGLMRHEGDFLIEVGKFERVAGNIATKDDIVRETQRAALASRKTMITINQGNLQLSIHLGTESVYVIINLIDKWLVGISYHGAGEGCCVTSFDALLAGTTGYLSILDEL